MRAPVRERDPRPGHEILDSAGDQDLATLRQVRHPSGEMHRDSLKPIPDGLAFTGVHARPDLQTEASHALADGPGALDRTRRRVERGEDAVASRPNLPATEARQMLAHQ